MLGSEKRERGSRGQGHVTISNVKLTCVGYGNNGIFFSLLLSKFSYRAVAATRKKEECARALHRHRQQDFGSKGDQGRDLVGGGKNPGSTPDRNGWRSDWGKDESRLSPVT